MSNIIIDNKKYHVKVAVTEQEQERGLMNISWPPPIMVFPFKTVSYRKFWMKNTPSPLDIVFMREGKIIDICYGKPFSMSHVGPDEMCDAVVEFPFGFKTKIGLKIGDNVKLSFSRDDRIRLLKNLT